MISLLRSLLAAIEGRPLALPSDADAGKALSVARRHRLTPLLSLADTGDAPASLKEAFRRDRLITSARNLLLAHAAEECAAAFAADGTALVLLKGLAYNATIYPEVGVRPTSDIDVLVPDSARRAAFCVLDKLGFEPRAAAPGFDDADYHEVAWTRGGVEVDLHFALAPLVRCHIDYSDLWANVRETTIGTAPAATLHPQHAAIFHALHMAIDHFDVPALYLIDFSRLLPTIDERDRAEALARAWGCWRPFATAVALTTAFIPGWAGARPPSGDGGFMDGVVAGYGGPAPIPRREQLVRKLVHFDTRRDAIRYLAVQGRRNIRELFERHVRRRSARERLALER